ncbi:glycoside hydrolase family 2 protein [Sphingobacterium sp. DN00404]|uniref:Glycoside hydrolase family 2 protein n=1 Tax=Sphingobacterium micropteri TaxID=2763501 RepID=A0ABR7YLJ8_9SPHI|nr:sugar-binding domain-containing protein [Sphingobacterium micropteri]MBD1432198.1 glycoside hydrolase family 2 protein [Sphingobacterium micropteri]
MIKTKSLLPLAFVWLLTGGIPYAVFAQPGFGQAEKINNNWRFHLGDTDQAIAQDQLGRSWRSVQLPHDWSVKQPLSPTLASATGYLPGGIGWYRKTINFSQKDKGKKLYIYFEGVYNRSEVFVNGQSIGKRPNGYISLNYDITPYIKYGEENTIAVKVDHSQDADSRWYTGSGIYRDVWLVRANPIHIEQWGVYAYPEVKNNRGTLHVQTAVQNETGQTTSLSVLTELLDPQGQVVAKKTTKTTLAAGGREEVQTSLDVKNPKLWSLETPHQYTLRTRVLQGKEQIDESEVKTGFRTLTFDPNKGFALNGEWMKMKGVCIHHDSGVLGAEAYPEVWRRRLLALKELGVNAIRTSHNPQAPSLYALCDELGLLVMNEAYDEWEFPKRKWLEGWNVGTPGFQGSYDFFEEWGEKDLEDMVKRDRNHISIFAWSIGNEVDYPNDPYSHPVLDGGAESGFTQAMFGGYKKDAPDAMRLGAIAKRLAAVVRKFDNRPITAGLAGVAMSNETEYPSALDIAGYNYTESFYHRDHERYPARVIYGSENRHDMGAWKAVRDNEHIFGQFLWTGIDYLGESGRWPSRGFYSGLLDFAGFVKPRGHFRQALWADKPVAHLGTYPLQGGGAATDVWSRLEAEQGQQKDQAPSMDAWPTWNYQEGQQIRVVCYTNSAQARLELNGKVVGETKAYNDEHGIIYWDIPYTAGKLEVIGLDDNNQEVVRQHIQSSKKPHAIQIIPSNSTSVQAQGGVAQIELQIVDEDGLPVILAEDEITCQVAGKGRLLGMEAGNNSDMGDYTDNKQRVYHGKMIVYVQANGNPDEKLAVRFTAPWLEAADVEITLN